MGARSRLLFLLVASLIGIGFALIPATEAETNHKIESFEHFDAKVENNIEISVENKIDKEIPYSLTVTIFSEDLQQEIDLDSSNLVFTIDGIETHYTNFPFTIPLSGNYVFNLTLLSNDDGEITTSSIEYEKLFYDSIVTNLEESITDYYLDENDNANWIFNEIEDKIELINIENEYNTGIILGPYNTKGNKNNNVIIENDFRKSETAEYTISYTTNFNSSQLYSLEWTQLHSLSDGDEVIILDIENNAEIYFRFEAVDSSANETNFWAINEITHKYITIKHDLEIITEEHYFFDINQNPEIVISLENRGLFDQQLGNITISIQVYSKTSEIGTYFRTPNLLSGEQQNINFAFGNLEVGNYYCVLNIILINEKIYSKQDLIFMSISTTNLLDETSSYTNFERTNIVIQIDNWNEENDYQITPLIENYYLIELSNQDFVIEQTNYRLISAISMDENRFEFESLDESAETVEGIIAPSIIFENFGTYYANLELSNTGFYSEEYQVSYYFAANFIESLDGPEILTVEPGSSSNFELEIVPLNKIPREGGSQLRIDISSPYQTKSITYVISYAETTIQIEEQGCNKHSVLVGQDIICTTTISNKGYNSNQLSIDIIVLSEKGESEIIDQISIEELKNKESLVLRTTYFPKNDDNFKIIVEVTSEGILLASSEINENINVVSPGTESSVEVNSFGTPKITLTQTVFAISIAGIILQFRRSENLKYLTFKFFIPMYSRLQKDTLADEPTRQKLLSTIYTEPGTNFTLLKEKLGLHNGTLAHHINILENNNMITSHRSGRQRLFFPFGGGLNTTIRNSLITNKTQKDIIQMVKENPGITQSMISQQLDTSRQKINYHVNCLSNNSILRVEKHGRITRLYPMHFT